MDFLGTWALFLEGKAVDCFGEILEAELVTGLEVTTGVCFEEELVLGAESVTGLEVKTGACFGEELVLEAEPSFGATFGVENCCEGGLAVGVLAGLAGVLCDETKTLIRTTKWRQDR